MKRVVNFEMKVAVRFEYDTEKETFIEQALETAKDLTLQGNKHTIENGVRVIDFSAVRPEVGDVRVKTFVNEESWYIDECYFDRICKSEEEIEKLIARHIEIHNGAEPYKVEITIL